MGSANVTLTAQWQWNNSFIGTKASTAAKEVGDIVFNDGSAMPYTTFTSLDTSAKNEKKAKAIALIFYKGTGLNSDILTFNYDINPPAIWTTNTSTTSRTLGVGLKHNKSGLAWCTNDAAAYEWNITSIQCNPNENTGSYTFTRDKNGSDNPGQVAIKEAPIFNPEKYPAFYFCIITYATTTVTNIPADSEFAEGWYLPSIAELYQIYACRSDTTNGFDIDAASEALGGDKFENSLYWSSSQDSSESTKSWGLDFSTGRVAEANKDQGNCICCIWAFD